MGKISELINQMIQRVLESAEWTSANPTHINTLIQINAIENPDFEDEIKKLLSESDTTDDISVKTTDLNVAKEIKEKKEILSFKDKFEAFDKGQVGDIQRLTSAQFSNVRSLATNPVQFMMNTVFRRLAKGAGVIGLALLIFAAVKFVISELLKPGRLLDRRFKRDIENEILAFRAREEKQKLRQGFTNIIVTTIGGLRGGTGQIQSTRGLLVAGQLDAVINTQMTQPGTTQIAGGEDLKTRAGRPTR